MLKLSIQKRRKTKRNRINEAFCQLERQVFIFRFASVCNDAETFEFLGSRLSKHRERVIFFHESCTRVMLFTSQQKRHTARTTVW